MSIANKILPYYTYEDWVRWEGQWELIEGYPFAMSPAPVPEHQRVATEIQTELVLALRKIKCSKCRAYQPIDYKISDDTIVQPDILIVCGEIKKKYLDFPPALVVEILSPATALKDRHTKYELYQQQGVKYYLIVDIDKKTIEVYHLKNESYHLLPGDRSYEFHLDEDCNIRPGFSTIFTP
jgi:Uma2 family endonuclease